MANIDPIAPAVPVALSKEDDRSYADWPAIFAGTVIAAAISLVLLTFGSAIGLSLASFEPDSGVSLFWLAVVTGLWVLWVQVSSFMAGGYLTGRLRRRHGDATEYESDIRDGSHGLVVWGLGVILGALITFWGVTGALTAATSATATAVGTVASEVDLEVDSLLVDRALRGGPAATAPVGEEIRGEVSRILLSAVAEGELDETDRDYLISIVAARAGISQEEAQARVDQIVTQAQQAEESIREAAETTRQAAVLAAFLAAASLLVSAVAAYFGATLGGKHRDEQVLIEGWYKPW